MRQGGKEVRFQMSVVRCQKTQGRTKVGAPVRRVNGIFSGVKVLGLKVLAVGV